MLDRKGILEILLGSGSGQTSYDLIRELYPFCRSITGDGVRETLRVIGDQIPLNIVEVPTGTRVFDWTVPKEWNISEAWIKDELGNRVVDFSTHNLHIVSYSIPVHKHLPLQELREKLYSLPDRPNWIPYRTNYYSEDWGFCIAQDQLDAMPEGNYEVFIDSRLEDGSLTYAECVIEGATDDEVLLSAHVCHPSMANDNLSGVAVLTRLAMAMERAKTRYTYRIIFAPGTIGSITWLAMNQDRATNVKHGLVVSCLGDPGGPTYKRSRRGDADIDNIVEYVLQEFSAGSSIQEFSPYGYDERQYCSPGFNLPIGLLERSKYGDFPEYHTSADNLEFIKADCLESSFELLARIIDIVESNWCPISTNPFCEPQLGKRGLYSAIGGGNEQENRQMAMLWVLNQADGQNSLLDIANRSGIDYATIRDTAEILKTHGLLRN
jgi:aminopeptidase-like protein